MDKRIKRTKEAVFNAVLELMVEMDTSKITVLELCKRAQINKSTFYLHYKSMDDCLQKCFDAVMNGVVEISKYVKYDELKRNPKPFIDSYIDEIGKSRDYLTKFKNSDICGQSIKILHDKLIESIVERNGFNTKDNYYEIANISFCVAGVLYTSVSMLPDFDKEQMSKSFCTMIKSTNIQ